MRTLKPIQPAPEGYRWANGGGSQIGDCNGNHLAALDGKSGTLCGRYGPHTPLVREGATVCGSCRRVLASREG